MAPSGQAVRQLRHLAPLKRQSVLARTTLVFAAFQYADDGVERIERCAMAFGDGAVEETAGLPELLQRLHGSVSGGGAREVALVMPNPGAYDAFHIYDQLVAAGIDAAFPGRGADGRIKVLSWRAGRATVRLLDLFELTRCAPDEAWFAFGSDASVEQIQPHWSRVHRDVARARAVFANFRRVVW